MKAPVGARLGVHSNNNKAPDESGAVPLWSDRGDGGSGQGRSYASPDALLFLPPHTITNRALHANYTKKPLTFNSGEISIRNELSWLKLALEIDRKVITWLAQ
jgi:hypothetical protein